MTNALNEIRIELIKAVQNHAALWDAGATAAAIEAVRSGDPEAMQQARISLARSSACQDLRRKIVEEIHVAFGAIERMQSTAKEEG